ncbi:MAG: PilZ domain-containing protein [Phycisphaerae bacterium]|nr:PilZ domain-containing protein [Phycisphaerae bacterium]
MLGHLKATPDADARDTPSNRRRHGRFRCDELRCSLGTVLDLSASGARIGTGSFRHPSAGATVSLVINDDDEAVELQALVVRSRRTGVLAGELAVEFLGVTPELRARLLRLARGIAANQSGLWSRGV